MDIKAKIEEARQQIGQTPTQVTGDVVQGSVKTEEELKKEQEEATLKSNGT
jgi:hypothetical protein